MIINDIILENPARDAINAYKKGRADAGGVLPDEKMGAGRFSDMARAKKRQAQVDKQTAGRMAGAKKTGAIGQFAQDKATMKGINMGVVADPTGMYYQYQQQKNGKWAWQNVDIKTGKKPEPGTFMPFKDIPDKDGKTPAITNMPGTYPLKDKDQLSQDLLAIAKGVAPTQSTMDKMKDRAVQAMGGPLASKTMADPEATGTEKAGAVAGAALGRLCAQAVGAFKPQLKEPRKSIDRDEPGAKMTKAFDLEIPKKKILDKNASPEEKIAAADDLLKSLQAQQAKNVNVDKYVDAMGPMLKASGLNKANPQWYSQFVQKARAMRMESFEFMNKVLEYWNMTWEDIGYKVVLSENANDNVLLFPIKAINEAVEIENLQNLAGI